jgi:hypothetical protein
MTLNNIRVATQDLWPWPLLDGDSRKEGSDFDGITTSKTPVITRGIERNMIVHPKARLLLASNDWGQWIWLAMPNISIKAIGMP